MSVRTVPANPNGVTKMPTDMSGGSHPVVDLGEGASGFTTQDPENPLQRKIVAYVRANMAELSNNPNASVWSLSENQLDSVFKQMRFTDTNGTTKGTGQLSSTVLHSVDATSMKSTFPIQLGVKIMGVENTAYSSIGNPYSMIVMSETSSNIPVELQKEDVSVAYDFARRYPGYNAQNLRTHNVTAVPARNMFFVDKSHPIIAAIQENSQSLQATSVMDSPDQLVKVSDQLMNALMPLVEEQVRNQIKVADLNKFSVQISPADYPSWAAAAEALSKEAVAPIRAQQKRALAAAQGDTDKMAKINKEYEDKVDEAQQNIATTPLEFSLQLNMMYNFL
jgi:hypothetical protein